MTRKSQVSVDFNEWTEDGRLLYGTVDIFDSSVCVVPGTILVAGDGDGSTVLAEVVEFKDPLVYLRPDMSTWEDGE